MTKLMISGAALHTAQRRRKKKEHKMGNRGAKAEVRSAQKNTAVRFGVLFLHVVPYVTVLC